MKSYVEYLAASRKAKINPDILAPSTARAPRSGSVKKRKIQPPLDMGYSRTENGKYNLKRRPA